MSEEELDLLLSVAYALIRRAEKDPTQTAERDQLRERVRAVLDARR